MNLPILDVSAYIGVIVDVTLGKSVHSTYLFSLHDEIGDPWNYFITNVTLILHARNCKRNIRASNQRCRGCDALTKNPTLQGVLYWMEHGVHENSRLAYHRVGGLLRII